jgi:hypothetical protein
MRAMTMTPPEAGSAATPVPSTTATTAATTPVASGPVHRAEGGASRRVRGEVRRDGRSCLGTTLALAVAAVSVVYLVNPGLGVLELLPDNLPLVGNLDEAFFTAALLSALGYLGLRLPFAAGARN